MMKVLRIASILLCLLLLVLPGLAIPFFGSDESDDENRFLADPPVLVDEDEGLNPDFDTDFEAWLCDHFAFRKPVVAANALLNYRLLHTSANDRVIAGADDWLFVADTVPDYTGEGRFTDDQLAVLSENLGALSDALARRGARLWVAVIPNKSSVYPQYMPARYAMRRDGGNIQRLQSACEALDVGWIDLLTPLGEAARIQDVYLRTDTHWNALGAAIASQSLLKALGRPATGFRVAGETVFSSGDLARMMGASGRLPEAVPDVVPDAPLPDADFSKYELRCAGPGEGELLVYRDSFGTAIGPWLAQAYGSTRMLWSYPLNGTYDCDDALILLCERNLWEYLSMPPVLEGQPDGDIEDDSSLESDDEDDEGFGDPDDSGWIEIDEDDEDFADSDDSDWVEVDEDDEDIADPDESDWVEVDEDDEDFADSDDSDWVKVDEDDDMSDGERRPGNGI